MLLYVGGVVLLQSEVLSFQAGFFWQSVSGYEPSQSNLRLAYGVGFGAWHRLLGNQNKKLQRNQNKKLRYLRCNGKSENFEQEKSHFRAKKKENGRIVLRRDDDHGHYTTTLAST